MSLKHYLELAYREAQLTSETALGSIQQITGTLQRNSDNLVLVYGGSFNPPHRGHINVLLSLLRPEVDALAVVILPSEDFHLRHKVANKYPGFFLRQDRKVAIFEAMQVIPRDRVWVWGSTWYPFKPFAEALVRLATADGFCLRLSHVLGPDNLVMADALSMEIPCALPNLLVTNRARHVADHFRPDGRPKLWDGFSEWHCRNADGCDTGESDCIQNTTPTGEETAADVEIPKEDIPPAEQEVVMWSCRQESGDVPDRRGYYLKFKTPCRVEVNSTDFRRAWMQNPPLSEASLNQLSAEALVKLLTPALEGQ